MQNFMKTIINAVQMCTDNKIKNSKKQLDGRISNSVADWNQNDSNADNYVKNRTHWEEIGDVELFSQENLDFTESSQITIDIGTDLIEGQTYKVIWDGAQYECVCRMANTIGLLYIGNAYLAYSPSNDNTGEPFCYLNRAYLHSEISGFHSIKIITDGTIVHKLDSKYIPNSDWSQNDENGNGYIKNRTHWVEKEEASVLWEETVTFNAGEKYISLSTDATEKLNNLFYIDNTNNLINVYWNDTFYDNVSYIKGHSSRYIGNANIIYSDTYNDTGEFFCFDIKTPGETKARLYRLDATMAQTITYKIEIQKATWHTLDQRYLYLDNKMDAANPVGTGSFSMNRKSGTTVGNYSHAEGLDAIASGNYSHAEGLSTTASGHGSHAEGSGTTASGTTSHAEGQCTIALGSFSHVQGGYNISDTSSVDRKTGRKKYAHIVGNGTSDTARSNAHTLDWNGIGWFQGGLQVGGTAQDGEGVRYVPAVSGPVQPGQLLSIKSVDENSKPTEWEVVDVVKTVNSITPDENGNVVVAGGSGGKSGVYILAEGETIADAPADADVVIDPAGTPDVDLSDYAKTEDIPTDDHINDLINTALGVIENGTY